MDTNKCPRPQPHTVPPPHPSTHLSYCCCHFKGCCADWYVAGSSGCLVYCCSRVCLVVILLLLVLLPLLLLLFPLPPITLPATSTASPLCLHTVSTLCSLLPGAASGSAASVDGQCYRWQAIVLPLSLPLPWSCLALVKCQVDVAPAAFSCLMLAASLVGAICHKWRILYTKLSH